MSFELVFFTNDKERLLISVYGEVLFTANFMMAVKRCDCLTYTQNK
jgi:hypothetical protein